MCKALKAECPHLCPSFSVISTYKVFKMKLPKSIQLVSLLSILFIAGCKKDTKNDPGPAPTVSTTTPADNATGVAVNSNLVMTFSESVQKGTGNILIKEGGVTTQTIEVTNASVTVSGTTVTINPTDFSSAAVVNIEMAAGVFKDLSNNNYAGITNATTWNFTVADITVPTVSTLSPANNATGVPRNNAITISFNVAMDPATINSSTVIVKQGGTVIPGTVTYSGTTATFTPTDALLALTEYTVTITTGAKTLAGIALAANVVSSFTTGGTASGGLAGVDLHTAINYVILAKTEITNIPTSAITGDLGLSPAATSFITGFALTNATGYATAPEVIGGKIYAADMADPTPITLTTAVNDMITAYNDAAGRPIPDFVELGTGNIGGKTLSPGLYKWTNTVTVPSSVTISGGPNDVWIFQIAGDLTVSSAVPGVNITLSGGAQAKNIFWQVAGTVTIGTSAHFEGIILSMTGITLQTGASLNGRALAQTAVILDHNVVTRPL